MKINSTINRYILKEMFVPFSINVCVFTFLFLMTKMVDITNWIVNYNLGLTAVLRLIFFTLPWLLVFIIPMSVMMAVLLTFLRLSGDNEIVALKSCGMSIYGLLPPVFFFGFLGFALTLFMTIVGVPAAKTALEEIAVQIAASHVDIGLKERTFNDRFKNVVLYVNKIDLKERKLLDIFIEDKRKPDVVSTVVAPEGRLLSEPGKFIFHLMLSNGTIHQTNLKKKSATAIRFGTYNLSLDMSKDMARDGRRHKSREEMSIGELRGFIDSHRERDKAYYDAQIILHRRFSIPVACLALGLLAFPLGIQSRTTRRSFGLILCLFFFLLYYLLLTAGYAFGENGAYPPVIGMWLPNILTVSVGLYFLLQAARERTLVIETVVQLLVRAFSRLKRFQRRRRHVHSR